MRRERRRGFTLVELLVVIGIIGILMAVLVPALSKARQASFAIKCASNLRSIGQGLMLYVAENRATFPPAYQYQGEKVDYGSQTMSPTDGSRGYVHWSSYLFKKGGAAPDSAFKDLRGWDIFQCPALDRGGHPPTNTFLSNYDAQQIQNPDAMIIDRQAPRNAYTVNEAIMPRNKWVRSDADQARTYRTVKLSSIKRSQEVVLATEYHWDARIISEASTDSNQVLFKTHRPVHGFISADEDPAKLDVFRVPFGAGIGRAGGPTGSAAKLVHPHKDDAHPGQAKEVDPNVKFGDSITSRLEWVGRNHGRGKDARTNFLYVDGHVESKTIEATLFPKFQWGDTFYSLEPGGDAETNPQ